MQTNVLMALIRDEFRRINVAILFIYVILTILVNICRFWSVMCMFHLCWSLFGVCTLICTNLE